MTEPTADWPRRDLIAHRAETSPERTAVIEVESGRSWTYEAFDERVGRVAAGLRSTLGSASGRPRVGVLLPTRVAWATVFHAVQRLGGSVVALDVERPTDDLSARVERTEPALVICGEETADLARDLPANALATVDEEPTGMASLSGNTVGGMEPPVPAERSPDSEALVAFTSGTTSRPKGVRLTDGNLVASATASAFRLGLSRADRWLCCLPAYHLGGISPIVRSAVYGSTVVVQRGFDAAATAEAMAEYDVTGVSLVPTQLRRLLEAGWQPPGSLRFVLLGGAAADQSLLEDALERGVPVHPTYGTTETASQIATATPAECREQPDTVGRPLVVTEVTVVADGEPAAPGETGEIAVLGPTVTPGYLDDDATEAATGPYGFETGDLGYRDEGGRLRITGRVDDRIVTGGENVDPNRVAEAIETHSDAEAAAVVGLPDEEWGQRVAALVVGHLDSPAPLRDHLEDRLAPYEVPKTVAFAGSLPRTASGTVDREAVRERLRE